ncbi:hypothetical protein GIB67_040826 [Kingdonia uniflora]|uniref:Transmembrane protein 18 n=1 Tax=Kingdonia uniflora TaxID=39325 RepID=A0A7J7P4U5_9MAGN|nr:hypothetical protein GIB67_040826 [Kingdonia uniflora]
MEELKSAINQHLNQIDIFTADLQSGFQPAIDNLYGFFHAIDWKEPWVLCLISFHISLLLLVFISRNNINFQMCFFLITLSGVYLAEKINFILGNNWRSFAGQNYFDPHGVFFSVLWSGPLLIISILILINTLFSLCQLIVKWKRAELKHRARVSRNKQD